MSCLSKKGGGGGGGIRPRTTTCIFFTRSRHGMDDLLEGALFLVSYFRFFSNAAEVLQSCLLRVGSFKLWRRLRKGCLLFLQAMRLLDTTLVPLVGTRWFFDVLLGIP